MYAAGFADGYAVEDSVAVQHAYISKALTADFYCVGVVLHIYGQVFQNGTCGGFVPMVFVGMGNDHCIHTVQNFIHAHRQPDQRHFGLAVERAGKAVHGVLGCEKRVNQKRLPRIFDLGGSVTDMLV